MATPNNNILPQPPLSLITDPEHAHALLRELSVSLGGTPSSQELLAGLESSIHALSTTARSTTPVPPLNPTPTDATPNGPLVASTGEAVTPASDIPMEDTTVR
ncbi:hypothetical protein PISMIDRAFT_11252 [Pisolithus microcarpus 441]|uniref:Uncharacterized protein n=1 Tax=Pisolithus microcarpus 441 TaxID=765257 RepID=A0A0C9ZTN2_9AGAM|nr:hypothetical protein PISMIDRAFT_11252 [Pisolithus microcarpus 441]